ncbi:MAG: MotA/TolQ/ExbB proton channel family protein, partial [Clostridia bacterium]|nr:MotA/TolQ/ExbB proton channel family protein [Clostridia bacterium]
MELTTLLGIVLAFTFIVTGIGFKEIKSFIDVSSMLIVFGGIAAATIVNYSWKDLKTIFKVMGMAFKKVDYDLNSTIYKIIELANIARKDGLLALDNKSKEIEDPFLKKGIMLVVDGTDPELIRNIMETEIVFIEERHSVGSNMLLSMSSYAPAFGMIGTLIGLINMLKNLNDSSTLGAGMAVALVTTFYG